ncbi:AvrD family protein [Streptomyces sp. NPDC046870]|uniref:AvrD family protein n=1 Tax=Streptomyces sp. NPDC046870 TaxID=3155135 RepID=UPI0034570A17
MTLTSAQAVSASVDDHLGPAEQRFFGRGFRRVTYDIGEVRLARTSDGSPQALSSVGVRYPSDWSKKTVGTDLRPHFSTVDGIVVTTQLAEACLRSLGIEPRDAWLRSVRMAAGSNPQEELDALPAEATLRRTDPVAGNPARALSRVDCAVGTMRVRCEIEHGPAAGPVGEKPVIQTSPDALLGPAKDRYFGTGFTTRRQLIRDVRVDRRTLRADAVLSVVQEDDTPVPAAGVEGAHQPSVSVIDAFVTALQLAQIMLYDLDGMRREDSDTLWMRQTTLTASRPDRPAKAVPVTTQLDDPGLLHRADGTWRTLTVLGEMAGIHVRSAVTHRLPEGGVTA